MYPYIEKLFSRSRLKKKYHLGYMQRFFHFFSLQDKLPPLVHVAGTNGKGSVCFKIAHALSKAGYKTALYSSPHYSCVTERIQFNEKKISKDSLNLYLEKLFSSEKHLQIELSFFELMTLAFLLSLTEQKIDIAIVETGLGGRLDATNIIHPILTVITSIGFDHQEILGNSLEAIAKEKAGIIKKHTPLILGPSARQKEILFQAKKQEAETIFSPDPVVPFFEEENRLIARSALEKLSQLGFTTKLSDVKKSPKGRFEELFVNNREIVLDAAHNLSGFQSLLAALQHFYKNRKIYLLFTCTKDKKISQFLPFFKEIEKVYLFPFLHERMTPPQRVEKELQRLSIPCSAHTTLNRAVEAMFQLSNKKDLLVYTGSIYALDSVREGFLLHQKKIGELGLDIHSCLEISQY